MAKFYSLFSGSKGNASIVCSGKQSLLIDAGVSCKQMLLSMSTHNIPKESISGILITHTHTDHVKGLRVLCKKLCAKVYATVETMGILLEQGYISEECFGSVLSENAEKIGEFSVKAFLTDHDAYGSCGFRIETPEERVCSVCTDLGHITGDVHNAINGSDLVLLESNYDPLMLKNGPYPPCLKARIAGHEGHLSNINCAEEALRLIEAGTTRLVLGHLSQENNTPYLAEKTVRKYLDEKYQCGTDYLLYISKQNGLKETVIF